MMVWVSFMGRATDIPIYSNSFKGMAREMLGGERYPYRKEKERLSWLVVLLFFKFNFSLLGKSIGTPSHFCSIFRGNLSVRPLLPILMLFIVNEVVIARLHHYSSDVILCCLQNTLSRHFLAI